MVSKFGKSQLVVLLAGIAVIIIIYAFGSIAFPQQPEAKAVAAAMPFDITSFEAKVMEKANGQQQQQLAKLKNALQNATGTNKATAFNALAYFFQDEVENEELMRYYRAENLKLENSQKNMTFAAHIILSEIVNFEGSVEQRSFRANVAKGLFEQALKAEPDNDSLKVGLAGSYLHGAFTKDPMQGTTMLLKMVQADSSNAFAQKMLGYGGLVLGQYSNAINRFVKSYRLNPTDTTLALRIAAWSKSFGNKAIATEYYGIAKKLLANDPQFWRQFEADLKEQK